jgi:hypothetical protein
MKHLLAGVAMAAALAIAAPVWAQTSTAPAEGAAGERTPTRAFMHQQVHNPTASPSGASRAAGTAGERTSTRRYMHHVVQRNRQEHGMSAAEQLNAQELQRIQAGAPPAPPPMTQ